MLRLARRLLRLSVRLGIVAGAGYALVRVRRGRARTDRWEGWSPAAPQPGPTPARPADGTQLPTSNSSADPQGSATRAGKPQIEEPVVEEPVVEEPVVEEPVVEEPPPEDLEEVATIAPVEEPVFEEPAVDTDPPPSAAAPVEVPEVPTAPEPARALEAQPPPGVSWVLSNDGLCPTSHPVKAKISSGIYHLPGARNYVRTKADRCYPDERSAEQDGLRAARQ